MKIKENIKLPITDMSNYFVVSDFDRTITSGTSLNSWCVLDENDNVCDEYKEEMEALQNYYHKIEIDPEVDSKVKYKEMNDWWNKHLDLFIKYKFSEELFHQTSSSKHVMDLRTGVEKFLKYLYENNIPLLIISAGLTNVIKAFLEEHDLLYDNIYVISNEIYFENDIAKGISHDIIHSMNKKDIVLSDKINNVIKGRNNVILFGDNLNDINMVDKEKYEKVISVGFVNKENTKYTEEFSEIYDIILNEDEDFNTVLKNIII